jgi:hypothetical protein
MISAIASDLRRDPLKGPKATLEMILAQGRCLEFYIVRTVTPRAIDHDPILAGTCRCQKAHFCDRHHIPVQSAVVFKLPNPLLSKSTGYEPGRGPDP